MRSLLLSSSALLLVAVPAVAGPLYSFTTIDVPGATDTFANGINASGQVVGGYYGADGRGHGFLLNNGVYTALNMPGASFTSAFDINGAEQVVGFYADATGQDHGFVLSNGVYTTLNAPGGQAEALGLTPPARSWDLTSTPQSTTTDSS